MTHARPSHRAVLRQLRAVAVSGAMAVVLVAPVGAAPAAPKPPSASDRLRELQAKQAKVRAAKAKSASQVNALKASDSEIQAALTTLGSNIESQSDLLEESKRAVTAAEAEKAAADQAVATATAELGSLKTSIKEQAIAAYIHTPSDDDLDLLSADDLAAAARERTLRDVRASRGLDATEKYREVQQDLELARTRSEQAAARATQRKDEVSARLASLQAAQAEQERFQDQVESRIEAALAEADSLSGLDTALSGQISSQQTIIARELAAQRAAASRRGRSSGGGGSVSVPVLTGSGEIVTVRGIRVHSSIAGNLDRMLGAAEAAGISMSGGGYRDPAGQIAVRRNNCGSSTYAIYQMPASSCSPPTARPGTSMHERGLAIDFTSGGRTLSRGSAAFNWLKANAASYGFYNLPSEPWHWSTNGN